jgi:hypothetical protein
MENHEILEILERAPMARLNVQGLKFKVFGIADR